MRFKAQYKSITPKAEGNSYWKTIDADDLSEAQFLADRMCRKQYRLVLLTSSTDGEVL